MSFRPPLLLWGLLLLAPEGSEAWPTPVYRNMVYDTLRLMPPSLGRVLWRNDEHLLRGVYRLEGQMASALVRDALRGSLSEATTGEIERRVDAVVGMVDQRRPFREIALELGKLLRIAADLADPSVMGVANPELARASAEYHRFITLHFDEMPLVLDRQLPSTLDGSSVPDLLQGLTRATDESARRVAEAFFRDGKLLPASAFDFRSVPFAEASLDYSRGVTAASFLWLAAWSKANGDFTGYRFFDRKRPDGLMKPHSDKERQ